MVLNLLRYHERAQPTTTPSLRLTTTAIIISFFILLYFYPFLKRARGEREIKRERERVYTYFTIEKHKSKHHIITR